MKYRVGNSLVQGWGINDILVKSFDNLEEKLLHEDAYVKWTGMLKRVYSDKYLTKYPSYIGCSVDEQWRRFSGFKNWYIKEEGLSLELDKDILFMGNKVYSEETCCFVPKYINYAILTKAAGRGELPLGVIAVRDKRHPNWIPSRPFAAQINDGLGNYLKLGVYKTSREAHTAWQEAKINSIHTYLSRYGAESFYNKKVADAMLARVDFLKDQIDKGIETTYL